VLYARDKVNTYIRKGSVVYVQKIGEGSMTCYKCNSDIKAEEVAHPIWDGPFPMSGSGGCEYESVPYCPKCETKPNFHGAPKVVASRYG
jgi:hypothetical protein